jgi:hypothetical protein
MAFPPSCGQIVRRVRARATQLSAGPRLSRVLRVFVKAARDVHGDHAMAEAFRFAHDEVPTHELRPLVRDAESQELVGGHDVRRRHLLKKSRLFATPSKMPGGVSPRFVGPS